MRPCEDCLEESRLSYAFDFLAAGSFEAVLARVLIELNDGPSNFINYHACREVGYNMAMKSSRLYKLILIY